MIWYSTYNLVFQKSLFYTFFSSLLSLFSVIIEHFKERKLPLPYKIKRKSVLVEEKVLSEKEKKNSLHILNT